MNEFSVYCGNAWSKRTKIPKYKDPVYLEELRIKNNERSRKNRLETNYKITYEEYMKLLELQDNKCGICNKDLIKPHLDHNHKTGKVRGFLCMTCNTGLGKLGDNIDSIFNVLKYLNKHL